MRSVAEFFHSFITEGRTHEVRVMDFPHDQERKRIRSFYLKSEEIDKFLRSDAITPDVSNVYLGLNPVGTIPRFKSGYPAKAKSTDIARIRNILIDVDAVRPDTSQPATDEENQAAIDLAQAVVAGERAKGREPLLVANSGNGAMVIFQTDLPTSEVHLVRGYIAYVANAYKATCAKIDTSVHDLPRVCRLIGTKNIKSTADSNDRYSRNSSLIETTTC